MILYRPFDEDEDYEMLCRWWKGHNANPWPKVVLPDGWIAHAAGVNIAASFLYMHRDKIGVIELTTTNPQCAMSRDLVDAVTGLYKRLEEIARCSGCLAVISFVRKGSWEERTMVKMGYATSRDDVPHVTYAKPLRNEEAWKPKGGVIACPSHS